MEIEPVTLARLSPLGLIGSFAAGIALRYLFSMRGLADRTWVHIELKGPLHELPPPMPRWRMLLQRERPWTLASLRRMANRIADDPRVTGVLLEMREVMCGWATATGFRAIVTSLRAKGKRVVIHMPHGCDSRELYMASAAEQIFVSPQSGVAAVGVSAGATFLRSFLARGGIETDIFARREYKGAGETFSRDGFSEPNREQYGKLLDVYFSSFVRALAEGRNKSEDEIRTLVDRGPFRANEAVEAGLVDGAVYEDEVRDRIARGAPFVKAWQYAVLRRVFLPNLAFRLPGRRYVGVIEVRGPIVPESQQALGRVADARRIVAALREARANPMLQAVILFVDSPGGSALASDLIAHEVERVRERKPVIACMADVAASGGYYVSAPCNEIIAQPDTLTGSIGVIAMRFVFEQTFGKLGLHHEVIRRGVRSDMMSPYRHWNEEERAAMDREVDGFYNDFVSRVAKGRGKTEEQIEPLARGRVYAGSEALELGLVDRLGGLDVAIQRAGQLAGMGPHPEAVLVYAPRETPDPAALPASVQALVDRLGLRTPALDLALNCGRETLFAFEDLGLL